MTKRFLFMTLLLATVTARAQVLDFNMSSPATSTGGDFKSIGINLSLGTYTIDSGGSGFANLGFSAGRSWMGGGDYVWMAGDSTPGMSVAVDPGTSSLAKFASNAPIGSAWSSWTTDVWNPSMTDGPWASGGSGYVGLRILNDGNTYYGRAAVSYDTVTPGLTVSDIAFELSPGLAIGAAVVPDPASGSLLVVAGVVGVAGYRRHKRKAAVTALGK